MLELRFSIWESQILGFEFRSVGFGEFRNLGFGAWYFVVEDCLFAELLVQSV